MNRLRNSEHLKFPVGNRNKKKANLPQGRWAGLYNVDSRAARTSIVGAAATENRCITGFARELLFKPVFSFWSYSDDRVFMKNYFRITRTFPGYIWLLLVRKAPGGQSTLLCAVLLLQDTQNKTSLFREKVSKLVKLYKKPHSEIPASRQKVANDFSQCSPAPF